MVGKHLGVRKDHPGLKNKENDENSGPTTTVFVGNISEKASDMLIRQLLAVSTVENLLNFIPGWWMKWIEVDPQWIETENSYSHTLEYQFITLELKSVSEEYSFLKL